MSITYPKTEIFKFGDDGIPELFLSPGPIRFILYAESARIADMPAKSYVYQFDRTTRRDLADERGIWIQCLTTDRRFVAWNGFFTERGVHRERTGWMMCPDGTSVLVNVEGAVYIVSLLDPSRYTVPTTWEFGDLVSLDDGCLTISNDLGIGFIRKDCYWTADLKYQDFDTLHMNRQVVRFEGWHQGEHYEDLVTVDLASNSIIRFLGKPWTKAQPTVHPLLESVAQVWQPVA